MGPNGEDLPDYAKVQGILIGVVAAFVVIITIIGPEAHGKKFEDEPVGVAATIEREKLERERKEREERKLESSELSEKGDVEVKEGSSTKETV